MFQTNSNCRDFRVLSIRLVVSFKWNWYSHNNKIKNALENTAGKFFDHFIAEDWLLIKALITFCKTLRFCFLFKSLVPIIKDVRWHSIASSYKSIKLFIFRLKSINDIEIILCDQTFLVFEHKGLFKEISILFLTASFRRWFLFSTLITGDMIWLWGCGVWLGVGQNKPILLTVLAFEFFVCWVYFLILVL